MFAAPTLLIPGGVRYFVESPDSDKVFACLLLSIPILPTLLPRMLIPRGTVFQKLWMIVVVGSTSLHTASLLSYALLATRKASGVTVSASGLKAARALTFLNLMLSFALAFLAFWILAKILRPPQQLPARQTTFGIDWLRYKLPLAIQEQPLQTLAFFLLSFAYVLYSIAFSLTLHDRVARLEGRVPSLHMEGLSNSRQELSQAEMDWCEDLAHRYITRRLYFDSGSPALKLDLDTFAKMSRDEADTRLYPMDCYLLSEIPRINACSLHNVLKAIACYRRDASIPVSLLSSGDYSVKEKSNRESTTLLDLTSLRVQQARYRLLELLPERYRLTKLPARESPKIEWTIGVLFPTQEPETVTPAEVDNREAVLVKVGPLPSEAAEWLARDRVPELLDYLYFTVYTITTTGYGDIRPMDGFAKFVTSLANLYEMFYIVIFFNVLISVSRERGLS
jgi:ion channel